MKKFWRKVHDTIQKIFKRAIPFKPELFLLNIMPKIQDNKHKHLTVHIVRTARLVFAQKWENNAVPDINELIDKLYNTAEMDILTEQLRDGEINKNLGTSL